MLYKTILILSIFFNKQLDIYEPVIVQIISLEEIVFTLFSFNYNNFI